MRILIGHYLVTTILFLQKSMFII